MSSAHLSRRVFDRQLDRTRVLAQWRRGEVSPSSLLDAASPLLASAQVLGEPTDRVCRFATGEIFLRHAGFMADG